MGRMKDFAVWLASCIVQHEMSDEEILSKFNQREDAKKMNNAEPWLKEQIQTVRKNPNHYRQLMGWQRGKDY